ncbi:MAG: hypothetical protein E6G56_01915 [Actinobacteria bacterium]|nr:MAG: hypothetical protein E6G56_01915 [Actinomycetota bacterium]
MARVQPELGMEAVVEELGERQSAVIVGIEDGGRRLVVACGGERRTFTLRALTGKHVEESHFYWGPRLRLGVGRPDHH